MTDSYDQLTDDMAPVYPILIDKIEEILKEVKRQLTTRQKIKNNRKVVASIELHKLIFFKFYCAIQDHRTEFGRTICLEKKKKMEVISISINFNHKRTLIYHLN